MVSKADTLVSPADSGSPLANVRLAIRTLSQLVERGQDTATASDILPNPTTRHPKHALLGDILAIASAACYAIYTLLLKAKTGDESRISMTKFFGFVGV